MKAENFAKLIVEKCTTKKGDLRKSDMEMLYHIIHYPHTRRRTFMWFNKGKSYRDTHIRDIEVLNKLGGAPELVFLVEKDDLLPKKGAITFKAGQTLKAGSNESINIKLWEGDIQSPIDHNRHIGVMKIKGTDIDSGVVPTGADIECEYEMSDSGTII